MSKKDQGNSPDSQETTQDHTQSDSEGNPKRRRIIKGTLAAGAAFTADKWSKPVVKHVTLPAHAGVSPYVSDIQDNQESDTFVVETSPDRDDKDA